MPKLHDKIYHAIIWRQNRLAMKWLEINPVTMERGLYKGAIHPLHHAVRFRNYSFARMLLKRGIDINRVDGLGQSAIQDATQRGQMGGIKWLIKNGADFEGEKDDLLLAAVRCCHLKIIQWLLDKGCDVNAVHEEDGQNPLQHCYEYCDEVEREKVEALLRENGAEFPPGYDP